MPKPSPAASTDQHGHKVVRPPGGGEIIPEHFNEGRQAAQHFSEMLRGVLAVPRAVVEKQRARNARAKQRRKAS